MKLATSIALTAGGKGSGPTAPCPQCGPRPRGFVPHSGKKGRKGKVEYEGKTFKGPKAKPLPTTVKEPLGGPKLLAPGKHVMQPAPKNRYSERDLIYRKGQEPKPDPQDLLRRQGTYKKIPKYAHNLEEGDTATLAAPVQKSWEDKEHGEKDKHWPVGTKVKVGVIHPPEPGKPALADVTFRIGRHTYKDKLEVTDLKLHEKHPDNVPKIDVKDVRPSKIKSQSTLDDGAKYTVMKPKADKDMEANYGGKLRPHTLKGKFREVTSELRPYWAKDFNAKMQTFFAPYAPDSAPQSVLEDMYKHPSMNKGTTVIIVKHYNTLPKGSTGGKKITYKKVVEVMEMTAGDMGHMAGTKTYEYKNKDKARAALAFRFGIKIPKKW